MYENYDGLFGTEQPAQWKAGNRKRNIQLDEKKEWDKKGDKGVWVGAEEDLFWKKRMITLIFLFFFPSWYVVFPSPNKFILCWN